MSTIDQPCRLKAVTAADTDLTTAEGNTMVTTAVLVGGAGTLVVTDWAGSTAVTLTVAAGVWLPMNVKRIAAASTATGIVAQYRGT